jgi:hypothetical protein
MQSTLARLTARRFLPALAAFVASAAVACGSVATTAPPPTPVPPGPASGEIKPILATTVLRVGTQRVAFLLATAEALIKAPEATVTSVFLGDSETAGESKRAVFHLWPYGVRGAYSTELTFDRPGNWRLDIAVEDKDGPAETQLTVEVAEKTGIPEIGAIPPLSPNETLYTVGRLEELTTDYTPDADLYQLTIAEAVITGQPTVIVFATPAFCTSPTCGPQVDAVTELKEKHRGQANFIHVELYENPDEIQGDLDKGRFSNLVHEWGLSAIPHWFNESWTFVLGADGRISQRFEGFATVDEMEEALEAALARAGV